MKQHLLLLALVPACIAALSLHGAIIVPSSGFSYTQDFSSLPATGTTLDWSNNSTIPGWYRDYSGTVLAPGRDASVQAIGTAGSGVGTQDGFLNVGQDGSTDRALVMRRANTTHGAFGVVFKNESGLALTSFSVGYTGEQWRRQGTVASSLYFEYAVLSTDAGLDIISDPANWTRVAALEFVSPNIGSGNTGINGDSSINRTVIDPVEITATVLDGQYLAIRWYQSRPAGDTTVLHALGVDSMSIAVVPEPSAYVLGFGLAALGLALLRRRIRDRAW